MLVIRIEMSREKKKIERYAGWGKHFTDKYNGFRPANIPEFKISSYILPEVRFEGGFLL